MEFVNKLRRIARHLTGGDDARHALLDISDDFLAVSDDLSRFPERLRAEVAEIRQALREVRPQFPSHRETSVLFDREGLGKKGQRTAHLLAVRIAAVCREVA